MLSPSLDAPDDLIPASAGRVHLAYAGGLIPLREARLNVGEPQDFADRPPAEQEPRRDLKPKASGFPEAKPRNQGRPHLRPAPDIRRAAARERNRTATGRPRWPQAAAISPLKDCRKAPTRSNNWTPRKR